MNYKMMGRFIAQILAIEAVFMLPALILSLCFGETSATYAYLYTLAAIMITVLVLHVICRGAPSAFYAKEGLVFVGVSWILLSLFGCLPF